jgi:hypothetical protein
MAVSTGFRSIPVSHLGFLCDAPKRAVLPARAGSRFVLQDLGVHTKETLGEFEDWEPVLDRPVEPASGAFGEALVCDFSSWTRPGLYRLVVPDTALRSPSFPIHDGVLCSPRCPGCFSTTSMISGAGRSRTSGAARVIWTTAF